MTAVKVTQGAITLASEHRNSRVLMSFAIFAAEVLLEALVVGGNHLEVKATPTEKLVPAQPITYFDKLRRESADHSPNCKRVMDQMLRRLSVQVVKLNAHNCLEAIRSAERGIDLIQLASRNLNRRAGDTPQIGKQTLEVDTFPTTCLLNCDYARHRSPQHRIAEWRETMPKESIERLGIMAEDITH